MLAFLRGKMSDRKLRLFVAACCRGLVHLLPDQHSRRALRVAERYADGEVPAEKLRFAWGRHGGRHRRITASTATTPRPPRITPSGRSAWPWKRTSAG